MKRKYNQKPEKICIKVLGLHGPEFIEMRDWLDENIGRNRWTHKWNTIDYFYFDDEEDAMAFKLMWG